MKLLDEGTTLQKKAHKNVGFAVQIRAPEDEAREAASSFSLKLNRWKTR